MDISTADQLAAVYAEAAVAFLETEVPQAILWVEDDERWDFAAADEEFESDEIAFLLKDGWDGQLTIEASTDPLDDAYDSRALTAEIAEQMAEEGVARALIENLLEQRERRTEDRDGTDEDDEEPAESDND